MTDARLEKIKNLLSELSFTAAELSVTEEDGHIQISITLPEEDSGSLIGYHGEKADALQLIVNLMWNQNAVVYTPVQVDINGYRLRRKQVLEDLGDKAAAKAIESGREILLPHLPAHERRLIHLFLEKNTDVSTYSEGEGDERRLVVRPNTQKTE